MAVIKTNPCQCDEIEFLEPNGERKRTDPQKCQLTFIPVHT